MKHLLLTRFQGALIGANNLYISQQEISPNQLILDTTPALMNGITSLITRGRFEPQDWSQSSLDVTSEPRQAIVAMLPLMLFFHDDRVKLRETLINVSHSWQLDWETCSCAIALGYIGSRALTESLAPRDLLRQLLDETSNLHPLLFQELGTIDRLLEQSSSLHQVTQKLTAIAHPIITPTVLAIYCFLYTPEDFRTSMMRAYYGGYETSFTCALTGILAGMYNSLTGIPIDGLIATQERERWLLSAESLLTSWAGIDEEYRENSPIGLLPASNQPAVAYPLPVAAPQTIQRRQQA